MANEIKTRIALKEDTLANWQSSVFNGTDSSKYLKKGEVAITIVETAKKDENGNIIRVPCTLMKVGDGVNKYDNLPWVSALAADVYEWAKKNEVSVTGNGNAITGASITDNTLSFVKGETFATKKQLDDALAQFGGDLDAITDNDHQYQFSIVTDDGTQKLKIEVKNVINGADANWTELTKIDIVGHADLTSALSNYYTKGEVDGLISGVEAKIPAELGVMSVTAGTGIEVTGTTKAPVVGVKANTYDAYGAADAVKTGVEDGTIKAKLSEITDYAFIAEHADAATKVDNALTIKVGGTTKTFDGSAENVEADVDSAISAAIGTRTTYTNTEIDNLVQGAKNYADANDANTAHTHANGSGIKVTAEGGIAGEVVANLNVAFELVNNSIVLYDKDDTSKTAIATLDASEFVKDSYLKNASYDPNTNILTFTFVDNEDNLQAIPVDLTDLVDVYTADGTSLIKTGAQFSIKDGGVTTGKIADKNVTKAKLETSVQTTLTNADTAFGWGDHAEEGYLKAGNITGKADKVSGAKKDNFAGLDANGNLIDSGKKAADFEVAGAAAEVRDYADEELAKKLNANGWTDNDTTDGWAYSGSYGTGTYNTDLNGHSLTFTSKDATNGETDAFFQADNIQLSNSNDVNESRSQIYAGGMYVAGTESETELEAEFNVDGVNFSKNEFSYTSSATLGIGDLSFVNEEYGQNVSYTSEGIRYSIGSAIGGESYNATGELRFPNLGSDPEVIATTKYVDDEITTAVEAVAKDAADQAAVVLSEAQKYTDEKVGALTTDDIAPGSNIWIFDCGSATEVI